MARTRLQAKKEEQANQQAADSSTSHAKAAQHANSHSGGDSVSESDDEDPVRRPTRIRGPTRPGSQKRKRSSTSSSSSSHNDETGKGQEDGPEGPPPPKKRRAVGNGSASKAGDAVENDVEAASTQGPRYRNVPEGAGHMYTFDLAKEDRIRWIGTTGCNTCVGTYFSISEGKCFVGHWNYEVQRDDVEAGSTSRMRLLRLATEGSRDASEYLISDYAFDWIRRDVKKKLADWQWSCGWGSVTTRMRASLIMICPHCDSGDAGRTYVGDAVAAGVKEFLCIIDDDLQPVKSQSFIVRHDGSRRPEVRFFEIENPGPESQRWQKLNHEDNHRCEQLKVRDDRRAVQELELDDPVALGEPEDSAVVGM